MNFLTPLAFALAALLPVIVALYFLKLRRNEQRVSSTYLWRTLVRDTAANAPWQRLKPNWLLLLQLLFLTALILALARPFTWSTAIAGSHLILVVDTSASMGARDVMPNRLGAAIDEARGLIAGLPGSARVTVIEAGAQVRVPVSGATDPGAALSALAALRPGLGDSDMAAALTLASAMAAREPDSEMVILSDGHVSLPENLALPGRVRYIPIGKDNDNQAIGAFSVQAQAGGRSVSAFAQVVNYAAKHAARRLVIYADGRLVAARDLGLMPQKAQALTISDLPANAQTFEARLEGDDELAVDDHAWAVAPATDKLAARLVTTGNRFLETALALLPNVETTVYTPTAEIQFPTGNASPTSNVQLTIFDSVVPTTTLPSGSLFFIAPLRSTEFFSVTGTLNAPTPVSVIADDPVLSYVDLNDVAIQEAARIPLPAWGRAVIMDGKTNAPLLIVGEQNGRRMGVLAFDLRRSDLPLRVAFPLLMANLLDELAPGGASGLPANLEPGRALDIPAPPQANALLVRAPDGQTTRLVPANGHAVFDGVAQLGVYEIAAQESAGGTRVVGRFAVNAFNPNESDITPRDALPISGAGSPNALETLRARDEWWQWMAWAALVLLIAEWLFAHRGQVARVLGTLQPSLLRRNRTRAK